MRISDWSSDVCSSDLGYGGQRAAPRPGADRRADRAFLRAPRPQGARCEARRNPRSRNPRRFRRYQVDRRGSHLAPLPRSEEHTSELQSLMRISYAVFCLKKKKKDILSQLNKIR